MNTTVTDLDQESDQELVRLAKGGNVPATEALIQRYRELVKKRVGGYDPRSLNINDLLQEGMIGLSLAIRDFRMVSTVGFEYFADLYITRRIMDAARRQARARGGELTPDPKVLPDGHSGKPNRLAAPLFGSRAPEDVVSLLADSLSERERLVLSYYLEGLSYREMSARLNVPAKSVDNALQRVKRKVASLLRA